MMNAFIASQFSYCPPVWMAHSKTMNNRINKFTKKPYDLYTKMKKISL